MNLTPSLKCASLLIGLFMPLCLLFSSFSANSQETEQLRGQAVDAATDVSVALATKLYVKEQSARKLVVLKERLPRLQGTKLIEFFSKYPEHTGVPNTSFLLVDFSLQGSERGKVVWFSYEYDNPAFPPTIWNATLVSHDARNADYLFLAKLKSWYLTLSVYQVELDKVLALYPFELDPNKYPEWPEPSRPLSQIETRLPDMCGIARLDVIPQPDHLLLHAERQIKDCPALYYRFNLDTEEWSQATLQERSLVPQELEKAPTSSTEPKTSDD